MNELVTIVDNKITIANDFVKKVINFEKLKKEIEYQEELLKEQLLEIMPSMDKSSVIVDGLAITYKAGTTRKSLDSKRLKEECPDVYETYLKESSVSPSISIKVSD